MVASKREAITAIMGLNPTANPTFLSEFSKDDLERYLTRLGRIVEFDEHSSRFFADESMVPCDPPATDDTWR